MRRALTTALVIGFAWALALLHGAAALGKALDLRGFVAVADAYRLVPPFLTMPGALSLTLAEAGIALGLVLPRFRRPAAIAAGALALTYGAALIATLLRGIPLENCGCFGVFLARPLTVWSPVEDLVLAALCFAVARLSPVPA
ncbi:MauE/DoxX family redox-associated membrane protein [Roseomonas sp. CCTCC AB2023176]|uniref:MauE/DoxX family redox-associated membrane protein n=1 Tax=Roseomonas sp. CCTCC AB2023176 TaxID=3342640 RepID=UPI0035DFDC60